MLSKVILFLSQFHVILWSSGDLTLFKSVCVIEGQCPVGDWASWDDWTDCSDRRVDLTSRSRLCAGPGPCDGDNHETTTDRCPDNGEF